MDHISRRALIGAASAGTALALAGRAGAQTSAPAARTLFGPAPGVAQLSRNENPYGPSPKAIEAM
ncbi:MAG: histidinol phosphate aminotransferase, partial [Sphingomonadaceae bacterium]|nr:histidinol phosphate aminotransferase [Sphingomonadaceae bacterium]